MNETSKKIKPRKSDAKPIITGKALDEEKEEEAAAPIIEEAPKQEEDKRATPSLDSQIQQIYESAAIGEELLHKMVVETGAREIEVKQAWDRLFDRHKVALPTIPRVK